MPSEQNEAEANLTSSEDAHRKLWFDYLTKLNDRNLQSARATGVTVWVLLGVAVAIVYRCVPLIPGFLSTENALKSAATIFLLELDAILHFLGTFAVLLYLCGLTPEGRLVPDSAKKLNWVSQCVAIFALTCFALAHFWLGVHQIKPLGVRLVLLGFGLLWVTNVTLVIRGMVKKIQEGRKYKFRAPLFALPSAHNLPFLMTASVLLGVGALSGVLYYLRSLATVPTGWVLPLGAANHCIILVVIVWILFQRAGQYPRKNAYRQLERDVVLEQLGVGEIKARFIAQILGSSVGEWLRSLDEQYSQSEKRTERLAESFNDRISEIEQIPVTFFLERQGRAKKLLEEYSSAVRAEAEPVQAALIQIKQLINEANLTDQENQMLKRLLADWTKRVKDQPTIDVRKRLEALASAKAPKDVAGGSQQSFGNNKV